MRIGKVVLVLTIFFASVAAAAVARGEEFGRVEISDPWVAASTAGSTARLRMTIRNGRYDDIHIIGLTTPAAARAAIMFSGAPDRARPIDSITVPAGKRIGLDARLMWVSLIGLTRDLKAGDRFPLTLHFARGPRATVEVQVGMDPDVPIF